MKDRIGFVGVGLMGHGMAKNLVDKGWPLKVIAHRRRVAVDDLVARGAAEATSLPDLARASDVIFLCLTGAPEVRATLAGLAPGLRPGMVVVDCSTSDPTLTTALHADLAARGVALADAPLSRTPKEAWEGQLDTMVGADAATFARIGDPLAAFCGRILHLGPPGTGHRMKLLNNFISLGYGALYAEALAMAARLDIAPATLDAVIRGGRMDCGFYRTFMDYPLTGNREAHRFTLANAAKDLGYLHAMATDAGVPDPVASAVRGSYDAALAQGGDGPDDYLPHLIDFVARRSGRDPG